MPTDSAISISHLLPEILLALAGCATLLMGLSSSDTMRRATPWTALLAVVGAILLLRFGVHADSEGMIQAGLAFDRMPEFVRASSLVLAVLVILVNWTQPASGEHGEFFSMVLFSFAGLMLVGSANDLIMLFLAIELVSIPTYVLVTLSRRSTQALEAGTKYFYLGAMSAAVTAYGFSFLYGAAGSATLSDRSVAAVISALSGPADSLAYTVASVGVLLSIAGLLFKLAAFPLHLYVADVYQGAASGVAGMLGFVPKLAGLVAIIRVLDASGWRTSDGALFYVLWLAAALSMTIGNVLALRQDNLKRMLAYSGVAHAGYMLVGLMAGPLGLEGHGDGVAAVLFYVVVYGIANLGAFALLGVLEVRGAACETVRDVAGLVRRNPGSAILLALAMFTLMGMPPTPGFWGKLTLFSSAIAAARDAADGLSHWMIALVVIALVNSALAAAYYLRVIASCLLYENEDAAEPAPREAQHMGAMLCGFLTLIFSIFPHILLTPGKRASEDLRSASTTVAPDSPGGQPRLMTRVSQAPE